MGRKIDFTLAVITALVFLPVILIVALAVKLTSHGGVLYWSERVGKDNKIFKMPKFRTMHIDTPSVATHLLQQPESFLSPIGALLRRTSLDELPQLWSIIIGDMAIVGPRPALFNQYDLIALRTEKGIHTLRPGLTGWAQINGRDNLSIIDKVQLDNYYFKKRSFSFDVKILFITFLKVVKASGVSH